jgi:hypothetical protein
MPKQERKIIGAVSHGGRVYLPGQEDEFDNADVSPEEVEKLEQLGVLSGFTTIDEQVNDDPTILAGRSIPPRTDGHDVDLLEASFGAPAGVPQHFTETRVEAASPPEGAPKNYGSEMKDKGHQAPPADAEDHAKANATARKTAVKATATANRDVPDPNAAE